MKDITMITPSSAGDGNIYGTELQAKEFAVVWASPAGGLRAWFFSVTDQKQSTSYKHTQVFTKEGGHSVLMEKKEVVTLQETGMDFASFNYLSSLLESDMAWLCGKLNSDGSSEKYPIQIGDGKSQCGGFTDDYSLEVTLIKIQPK